jgi:nucleotide-binding universal stress UspA family protein
VAAVRRVVVGVSGSLGSLQALRLAADEARAREATLVPVIAWIPPGGDFAERSHPSPYLRQIWREAARQRLADAFDAGLGGLPDDVAVLARIEIGRASCRERVSCCV